MDKDPLRRPQDRRRVPKKGRYATAEEVAELAVLARWLHNELHFTIREIAGLAGYRSSQGIVLVMEQGRDLQKVGVNRLRDLRGSISARLGVDPERVLRTLRRGQTADPNDPALRISTQLATPPATEPEAPAPLPPSQPALPGVVPLAPASSDLFDLEPVVGRMLELASELSIRAGRVPSAFRGPFADWSQRLVALAEEMDPRG